MTVRVMGREEAIPKLAVGEFGGDRQLPALPFFLKGRDYTIEFIATAQDGRTTSAQATIHLAS